MLFSLLEDPGSIQLSDIFKANFHKFTCFIHCFGNCYMEFIVGVLIDGLFKMYVEHCTCFDELCYALKYRAGFGPEIYEDPTFLKCAICPLFLVREEEEGDIIFEEEE